MHLTHKIAVHFEDHVTPEEAQNLMDGFAHGLQHTKMVKQIAPIVNKFDLIRDWAKQKGILDKGDQKTQTVKLLEEAGEIAKAILKSDTAEIKDGIGDVVVVLTSLAYLSNLSIEDCISSAYEVIKSRQGLIVDGDFQKSAL